MIIACKIFNIISIFSILLTTKYYVNLGLETESLETTDSKLKTETKDCSRSELSNNEPKFSRYIERENEIPHTLLSTDFSQVNNLVSKFIAY